jgi:hypothetical protein
MAKVLNMEVKTIKEGILIPRGILKELGIENFEVLTRQHEILIRPRTSTRKHYGFVGAEKINEEFVLSLEQDWSKRGESEAL